MKLITVHNTAPIHNERTLNTDQDTVEQHNTLEWEQT